MTYRMILMNISPLFLFLFLYKVLVMVLIILTGRCCQVQDMVAIISRQEEIQKEEVV